MAKLILTDPTSLSNEQSFLAQITTNNTAAETAMEKTLSRDGTSPNQMEADLDMNSNQIINLIAAATDTEPVRKAEFDTLSDTVADLEVAVASFGPDQIPGLGDPDADRIIFWDNSAGDDGQGRVQYLTPGTGLTITATTIDVAPSIGLVDSVFTRTGDVVATAGDYTATLITNTPAGNIAATNVQTALNELDTEKLASTGYTAADVLAKLITVDGVGSGLDADLLDGKNTGTSGNVVPLLDGVNTWSATQNLAALVDIQQDFRLSGDVSPAQITADQNNYTPTGLSTASVLRLSTDAKRNLTGLSGGADGRFLVMANVGTKALVLANESASSTAANRFSIGFDFVVGPKQSAILQYDATDSRWTIWGTSDSYVVTPQQFGAKGDNATDDTAAFNAVGAMSNVEIFIPESIYRISSWAITGNNLQIRGAGFDTKIVTTSSTAHILDIGNGTDQSANINLSNFRIWTTVNKTAGSAIRARKLARSRWENVYVGSYEDLTADGSFLFDGITLAEFADVQIETCHVKGGDNDGLTVYGNAAQTFGAALHIDGGTTITDWGRDGIHIAGGAGGVTLGAMDVSRASRYGLKVSDDLGLAENREIMMSRLASIDSCTTGAALFDTNSVSYFLCDGGWLAATTAGYNVDILAAQPTGATFEFSGAHIRSASSHGLVQNDGHLIISGGDISGNGTSVGGGHGIFLTGAGVDSATITGSLITSNGNGTAGAGIAINSAVPRFNITAVTLISNGTVPIDSTGVTFTTEKFIRGCSPTTVNTAVSISEGGTAASTAVTALTNLGAAASGANVDITSLAALTSINGGQLAGFRNLLINAGGRVNQRAPATNADDSYGHDRWYALTQTGTIAVSTVNDAENGTPRMWRLTQSQAAAQRMGYAQIIEGTNCKHLRGKQVTLSGRFRCSASQAIRIAVLEWTGTEDSVTSDVVNDWTSSDYTDGATKFFIDTNFTPSGNVAKTPSAATLTDLDKLTVTLGSTFNNLVVLMWTEGTAAQNVTLDGALQLEQGAVATAREFLPFSIEDTLCQRYTQFLPTCPGTWYTTTTIQVHFFFPVKMRVAPSVTFISGTSAVADPGIANYNASAAASVGMTTIGGSIDITTAIATLRAIGYWRPDVGSIQLDAEL